MADYAIGDVQGCFEPLKRLLESIGFDDKRDRLWFVGDLVNRGPQSLEVLRFIQDLTLKPIITLGNHDLHFLAQLFNPNPKSQDLSLMPLLQAPDALDLGHWLRKQRILYHDEALNIVMTHAGIAPIWNLKQAKTYALELEHVLSGDDFIEFLKHIYGNEPASWSEDLSGFPRLRAITNFFTRMRFCTEEGSLVFDSSTSLEQAPPGSYAWFSLPKRKSLTQELVFGHWASLRGLCPVAGIHAIDTGCVWGGPLTALRLQDRQRFSVPGLSGPKLSGSELKD